MKIQSVIVGLAAALAMSATAHAAVVTYTFNASALTTAVKQGSDGTGAPNIVGVTAGYYLSNGGSHTLGGSMGYYGSYGAGVSSTDDVCGPLPANTSTVQYRCAEGDSDSHFFDNNGNGATIERRVKSGSNWGSWRDYESVKADDFARIQFDADVTVTSLTLGLWDWNKEMVSTEQQCTRWRESGSCRTWTTVSTYNYFIDLMFNTGDSESSAWSSLKVSVGASEPDQGDTLVVTGFGPYAANDWFGIGAGFGLKDTGFKLLSMTVEKDEPIIITEAPCTQGCTVPEPGVLASVGLGIALIGALGAIRRRRG